MILSTPKKLAAFAKVYAPAWLSPARLFTLNSEPPVITELPRFPTIANLVVSHGVPKPIPRNYARGPNGSFHNSRVIRMSKARKAYNSFNKKRIAYYAQQAKAGPLPENITPLETVNEQDQVDPEERIFHEQLAKLKAQANNLNVFEKFEADLYHLEDRRSPTNFPQTPTKPRRSAAAHLPTPQGNEDMVARAQRGHDAQRLREEEARAMAAREEVQRVMEQRDREQMLSLLRNGCPARFSARLDPEKVREAEEMYAEELASAKRERAQRRREERERRLAAVQEQKQRERIAQLQRDAARRLAREVERQRLVQEQEEARIRAMEDARRRAQEEEWLRAEQEAMWAEQRRRDAEAAALLQAEREAQRKRDEEAAHRQAETERLAREEAQAAAMTPFVIYDLKWKALKGSDPLPPIRFFEFPWPLLQPQIANFNDITLDAIDQFLVQRGDNGKTRRDTLKAEILKWHPDKFRAQLHRVLTEEQEAVREGGELVTKFLNTLMERVVR